MVNLTPSIAILPVYQHLVGSSRLCNWPQSTLAYFSNFEVHTVLDLVEELNLPYDSNAPDHSFLLIWKYLIDSTCNAQQFYSRKDIS